MIFAFAEAVSRPSSSPEFTAAPSSVYASVRLSRVLPVFFSHSAFGVTTVRTGRPNCLANAKSRSSWAGTAMMAPVP